MQAAGAPPSSAHGLALPASGNSTVGRCRTEPHLLCPLDSTTPSATRATDAALEFFGRFLGRSFEPGHLSLPKRDLLGLGDLPCPAQSTAEEGEGDKHRRPKRVNVAGIRK